MKYTFVIIPIFLLSLISYGQRGNVKGKVTFKGKPEELVNVYVTGSTIGTTTDSQGNYELKNIPIGKKKVIVSFVGFKTQNKEVTVVKDQAVTVDFQLKEDILGLDQVVVSATRTHLNRKLAPVIVTVTDSKLLESVQAVTLSEGLSFQPGLRFETNCQNCGYSQVRINGLEGAYSQILVDSRPIFSSLAGVYGLDQIPANTIERIEVVRGGGSALYGSNAIAGTINIITKDPTENSFQAGSNLALINGEKMDASIFTNGTVVSEDYNSGMTFFGLYRRRNPYDHNGDSFTEMTKVRSKSFGAKGFFKPNDRSRLSAEFTVLKEFRRGGNKLNLLPFESDITEQIDSDVLLSAITYETANKLKTNRYSFYASGSLSENENYYGGKPDLAFGTSKDKIGVLGGQFIHNFEKDVFTGGLEFKYNQTNDIKKSAGININQTLRMYGLYAQYEWNPTEKLKLLGGLRADFHNLLKNESVVLNPRFNILYRATDDLRFRASYAKGFRAPQFFTDDLHVQIAAGELQRVILSKNLVSETSHSFTASIDWSKNYADGSQIGITIEPFYTLLDNPFILEPTSDVTIQEKRNGDQATVLGTNIELKYAPNEQFIFQAGATVQQGKFNKEVELGESETGKIISSDKFLRSPNFYGNFVATYAPTKSFQNNLSAVYTGSMDVDHTLGERVYNGSTIEEAHRLETTKSFFELNWKSSYNFSLNPKDNLKLQLSGGIQNIFDSYQKDFDKGADRDAAYIYGPSRPRTFFIGLKLMSGN